MSTEQKFVWISKYALTKGVYRVPLKKIVDGRMVVATGALHDDYFHGLDWHLDERSAIDTAESMRARKIISLRRQMEKLHKLSFAARSAEETESQKAESKIGREL